MKRIFSMILAVSLAVTLLAGASVFAADYDDTYVFRFGGSLALTAVAVTHEASIDGAYGTITTNTGDPSQAWFFFRAFIPNTQKYVAIKYATEFALAGNLVITADENDIDPTVPPQLDWGMEGTEADPQMTTDGEWHLAIYEIASTFTGVGDLNLTTFRMPAAANVGETIDVAYIGFFETVEEAKAFDADYSYDYDLPSDSAEVKDPENTNKPEDPADKPADPTDKDPADTENPTSGDNTAAMLVLVVMAAASVTMILRKRSYEG